LTRSISEEELRIKENFLGYGWDVAQSDFSRSSNDDLNNTNNFTEAQIRWLLPINRGGKANNMYKMLKGIERKITVFERELRYSTGGVVATRE